MNDTTDIAPQAEAAGAAPRGQRPGSPLSEGEAAAPPAATAVRPLHSLAVQVPLLLVIALSLAVAVGAWGLRTIVLRSFERLEVANAELDLRRFANAIEHEVGLLEDLLAKVAAGDRGTADVGELDILPLGIAVAGSQPDLACLFDGSGALISSDVDDPGGGLLQLVSPSDFCALAEVHPALPRTLRGERAAGLFDADGVFFLVAAQQVPTAGVDTGVPGRVLLLARLLSAEELGAIAARLEVSIDFWSMQTPNLDVLEAAAGAALSLGAPFIVNKRSEDLLQVYWAFQDAGGEPAFLARANVFRDLRVIGDETVVLSALAMGGVGVATILLSLVLVRSLMVQRLSRLTGRILGMRRGSVNTARLSEDGRAFRRRDEIGVLAEEFDKLLDELSATSQQLADVSYRAGRAEVTEGSLHNIGNALNSLLTSAESARARIAADSAARIAAVSKELAAGDNLTERQSKLAQFAALAAEESTRRVAALQADMERVALHIGRIEDILESQRRLGSERDLAVVTPLLPLIESAARALPEDPAGRRRLRLDGSLESQPPVRCVRAVVLQVFSNLLVNAVEAIERGGQAEGRIDISAETVDVEGTPMVKVSIADNGTGLEPSELVKVFQRHYTTKTARGHGIGLHWCANVVTSMGGQLYASSEGPGRGATLHLLLPAAQRPQM